MHFCSPYWRCIGFLFSQWLGKISFQSLFYCNWFVQWSVNVFPSNCESVKVFPRFMMIIIISHFCYLFFLLLAFLKRSEPWVLYLIHLRKIKYKTKLILRGETLQSKQGYSYKTFFFSFLPSLIFPRSTHRWQLEVFMIQHLQHKCINEKMLAYQYFVLF